MSTPKGWLEEIAAGNIIVGPQLLPENKLKRNELIDLITTGKRFGAGVFFYSYAGGTGKSAAANALAETGRYNVIRLDGGDMDKETTRDLKQKLKQSPCEDFLDFNIDTHLVIVNEASDAPNNFLRGLRNLLDNHVHDTLFVFTDNYGSKLIKDYPQVFDDSRVVTYDFSFPDKGLFRDILQAVLDEKEADVLCLQRIIQATYPDLRKAITTLERTHTKRK